MTKIYFVRHARPDFSNHDDYSRPLTEEGLKDCKKVTEFLQSRSITKIFSSPYKRSFDTIRDFARKHKYEYCHWHTRNCIKYYNKLF